MQESIRYAGRTDTGRRRDSNQDQFLIADLSRSLRIEATSLQLPCPAHLHGAPLGQLFLVADGMGGHQAGNRASELAIHYMVASILNSLRWMIRPTDPASEQRFLSDLKDTLSAAHRAIVADSNTQAGYQGMGTTLTMAYVVYPKMWVVHAGDTRCYILRRGELRQVTRDHTMASQFVAQGSMSPDQSERSPWANVLWNALGAGAKEVVADIYQVDLQLEDRLLLCSDGLNKHLQDDELKARLTDAIDLGAACEECIREANERGGTDNITVVMAEILQPRPSRLSTSLVVSASERQWLEELQDYDPGTVDDLEVDGALSKDDEGITETRDF